MSIIVTTIISFRIESTFEELVKIFDSQEVKEHIPNSILSSLLEYSVRMIPRK